MKHMAKSSAMAKLTTVATYTLALVFILVPFHALLTVAISTITGHYDLWRLWKEALLVLLTPGAVMLVWKTPGLWKQLRSGWLFWSLAGYVLLNLLLGVLALAKGQVNAYAMLYAWVIDLRLVLVFIMGWIITARSRWLHDHWKLLLVAPACLVILFGLLQASVLPADFLRHLGYGEATIAPYGTVDQKLDYVRIQSTLRGSNPLGAYLVLVLAMVLVLLQRTRSRLNLGYGGLLLAGCVVMMFTYSRSAYIGLSLTAVAALVLLARSRRARKRLAIGLVLVAVIGAGLIIAFRDNDHVENTFFHTDETSVSVASSNQQRATALQAGLHDVLTEPFGRGPGTAGPASAHNDYPARIAEDYYLQIGQETGWLGLGLFVAIVVMVGRRLWRRRDDPLARALFLSLIGLSFINIVQHAWADDTLAILWWGFAGVAVATPLVKPASKAAALTTSGSNDNKAKKVKRSDHVE